MTTRNDFTNTWLVEMPSGIGISGHGIFRPLVYAINDRIRHGSKPTSLANGYRKIVGQSTAYYWHENGSEQIDIAVELAIAPQGLIVNGVGKPEGSPMHASDLYELILNDNHKALRLLSDELLSDQGLNLWKRLLSLGHKISVYDQDRPEQELITLHSEHEMDQYFKHSNDKYRRYQYVLSESGEQLAEVRSTFNTHRMRVLAGLL